MIQDSSNGNLLRNNFLYESCLPWIESLAAKPEPCLSAIADTAFLAWWYHPGRFADGALENPALRFGRDWPLPSMTAPPVPRWRAPRASSTLHVATELHPVGGHTRMLARWAARDTTSNHAVVLTRHRTAVPEFFERAIVDAGGTIICLRPSDPAMVRAAMLRDLATRFDRVFLHIHPNDPVPVVAFAQPGGPPVATFNHAHFSFGLGPTIADLIINTTGYAEGISRQFRFARETASLTSVPGLWPLSTDPIDKAVAKADLGIDPFARVVLSIGSEVYFKPSRGYDFPRTARRLLDANPDAYLLLVGPRADSPWVPDALRGERRCRFVGPVVNPVPYYRAADVCLESFPVSSPAGVLEAVAYGEAFSIPMYGPGENILRWSLSPVLNYAYRPADEDDYVAYVNQTLSRLPQAREEARASRLAMVTFDLTWDQQLTELNRRVDQLAHHPVEIPGAPMIDSFDCRVLADLRVLDLGGQIDLLLPFRWAVRTHLAAVRRRYSRPRALGRVGRLAWRGVRERLSVSSGDHQGPSGR